MCGDVHKCVGSSCEIRPPLLFAALGEILTERSGVLNLGLEGLMLIGAVTGFVGAYTFHNVYLAFLLAVLVGGAFAFIHAFMSITLRVNQVVSGLALTMLGMGISGTIGRRYIGEVIPRFSEIPLPYLSNIPIIGKAFFNHDILVYLSYILTVFLFYFIFRTKAGMTLRAVGEEPTAADSLGINVFLVRYLATVIGGAITAVGGAYLSLAYTSMWIENMSAGIGSYLFGGVMAIQLRLQAGEKSMSLQTF